MIYKASEPTAEERRAAQAVLDQHITLLPTGRCKACGALGPCYKREAAVSIMSRYLWLPVRTPGATRPELARVAVSDGGLLRVG